MTRRFGRQKFNDAVLAEGRDTREYFANGVYAHAHIKAEGWTVYDLTVNASVVTQFGNEEATKALRNALHPDNLDVALDGEQIAVSLQGEPFYTIDVSDLLADLPEGWHAEAIKGFGPRQVILLMIADDFTGERPRFLTSRDMNPNGEEVCTEKMADSVARSDAPKYYQCQRPKGHPGGHKHINHVFSLISTWDWSAGGGSGRWEWEFGLPTACDWCGFVNAGDGTSLRCFTCRFWEDQMNRADNNTFIVGGRQYKPGKGGFYGRAFYVQRKDGTLWTGELFTQGSIPEHLRDKIVDNAEFIDKDEWRTLREASVA